MINYNNAFVVIDVTSSSSSYLELESFYCNIHKNIADAVDVIIAQIILRLDELFFCYIYYEVGRYYIPSFVQVIYMIFFLLSKFSYIFIVLSVFYLTMYTYRAEVNS